MRLPTLALLVAACGGGSGSPPALEADAAPGEFDKRALLVASADCVVAQLADFQTAATALRVAAEAHAADPVKRPALEDAWKAAMASWEIAELYQVGPAALSTSEPGGKDLRDQIYAWPLTSPCKVDEQLVAKTYEQASFATSAISGRGLGAIEYLVFYTGTANACTSFSPINTGGDASPWSLLSAEELATRRAAYAAAAATLLEAKAGELVAAWADDGGGFRAALVSAGSGSKLFASSQAGLNAITNAFFYLDKAVKDGKLAVPTGMSTTGCGEDVCPNAVESRYARRSLAHLEANLLGFERLFAGCGGTATLGFDDWLIAAKAPDVAADLLAATADARAAAAAITPSFEDVLASDPEQLRALHAKIKVITDLLKADFVTTLDLELPASVESDND
jgi:predicted lipoprotein